VHSHWATLLTLGLGGFLGEDMTLERATGLEPRGRFPKALGSAPVGFELRHVTLTPHSHAAGANR